MQRKFAVLVLAVVLLVVVLSSILAPQVMAAKKGTKVVFVLIDNITWADIIAADDPVLNDLIKTSSIGLLNNRAFKAPSRSRNALTVGAGVRSDAGPASFEEYNATETYSGVPASEVYKLRTGKTAKEGQVLELGIASIIKDNANGMQDFTPGALGSIIEAHGGKTAVLGNADTSLIDNPDSYNRVAVTMAMNDSGTVELGSIGKDMLMHDPKSPFSVRTDYTKMKTALAEYLPKADFIVLDLGDTVRADYYSRYVLKRRALNMKMRAIHNSARFLKQAMEVAGPDTVFIVGALSAPGSTKAPLGSGMEQLTPIIVHGSGFKPGPLVADTTNREGLVTIIDITPTILDSLGMKKGGDMPGSVMRTGSSQTSPQKLDRFNQSAIGVKDTRRTAILAWIYIQIILYVLAALVIAYRKMLTRKMATVLATLIFTTMSFPLFSFYATKFESVASQGTLVTLLTVAVSLLFASLLIAIRKKALHPILGIALLNVVVLSVEVLMGGPSFINSIFGYDPIRGARFFGIGNEAMSILLANGLLLFGLMLEKVWNKWTVLAGAALSVFLIVLIGFPGLGTNTDGPITVTATFTTMVLLSARSKNKFRNFAVALVMAVSVLALFAGYDATHGATTHMGKSVNLIISGGFPEALMIIKRKLATNLMIFKFSTWSYFLFIMLGLAMFLWMKPTGVLSRLLARYRGLSTAISASIVGGIIGFLFNDSGILIPAIIMSYMIPTVIYLMIWEQYRSAELEETRDTSPESRVFGKNG